MGEYMSTTITSPQVIAAGGLLVGDFTVKSPHAGHFYGMMEQYTSELVFIPGSRAYLYQAVIGDPYVNDTVHYTVVSPEAADEEATGSLELTLPNTDCYTYLFLKEIASIVVAGSFVVGNTYKILSIGTTDFTLVGAASNTVGLTFVATGVGAGTGTVCTAEPDTDPTIDYVVITVQSTTPTAGIDLSEIMNLMITMMVVMMMMKMMASSLK